MDRTGVSGRYHLATICTILLAAALIAALAGCGGDPGALGYELSIESTDGGSVTSPGEGISTHSNGSVVGLVAVPEEGYRFGGWTGDIGTIADVGAAQTTILVNGHYSIIASFEEIPPVLYSLTVSNCRGGSVTAPGAGTFYYEEGTSVALVANPATGYLFGGWTGDVDAVADVDSPATTIVMNGDYFVEAGFETYWIEIWDWHDLDAVRGDLRGSYLLMTDLDASTPGYKELAGANAHGGKGWQPIADGHWNDNAWIGEAFTGNFHGQGHEIRGLRINRPESGVGMFSYIGTGGVVESVGLVDANVSGSEFVGILAAFNHGGTVNDCYSSGRVRGNLDVGGLVGWNWDGGRVRRCHSVAIVTSTRYAGGLVGYNSDILENSYTAGSVSGGTEVGGLLGGNSGKVTNSYSIADVYGEGFVGGLVGSHGYGGTVSECYAAGSVFGLSGAGGLVGRVHLATITGSFWDIESSGVSVSGGGTGKTTAQLMTIATYTDTSTEGLDVAWDIAAVAHGQADDTRTWNIVPGQTYPFLSWQG